MRAMIAALLGAFFLAPATAGAQYEPPEHPAEPAAQLAEMLGLYEALCLQSFPDDAVLEQALAGSRATALAENDVRRYLRDDPGKAWRLQGETGTFVVTLEHPPFHACGVRTMTANAFPDIQPYRDLVARYESGRGFTSLQPMNGTLSNHVTTAGGGDMRNTEDGGAELLMFFVTSMAEGFRNNGQTGVEVRFVHQFAPPQR